MNIDGYSSTCQKSLSCSDESLHCDFLTESLFDERSLLTFFNDAEQRDIKSRIIRNALADHNLDGLTRLGSSNFGFVTTDLRSDCWLMLLMDQLKLSKKEEEQFLGECGKEHVDENQVYLDVKRSFTGVTDPDRKERLRNLLQNIIVRLLRKYPKLRYYQGYHDVVSVFVTVFIEGHEYHGFAQGEENLSLSDMTSKGDENYSASEVGSNHDSSASTECYEGELSEKTIVSKDKLFRCVEAFTLLYLRDFMMNSLDFPIDQLNVIPQMIKSRDKQLFKKLHLDKIEPFFAISSILTIYSHELKPVENQPNAPIFLIFDYVISSQSMLVPLTMYSTLILDNKDKILREIALNVDNFENTVDLVHGVMQQVLTSASYDEGVWEKVLRLVRSTSSKDNASKYKKVVNKFSTILTTASGPKSNMGYNLEYVTDLLDKEINENAKRKAIQRERRLHPRESKPLVRLFLYAHNHTIPFICRVSLLIGLMALLVRAYRGGQVKALMPTAKIFMRKFQGSSIAGLYRGTKIIWLDPLHELLKGSLLSKSSTSSTVSK